MHSLKIENVGNLTSSGTGTRTALVHRRDCVWDSHGASPTILYSVRKRMRDSISPWAIPFWSSAVRHLTIVRPRDGQKGGERAIPNTSALAAAAACDVAVRSRPRAVRGALLPLGFGDCVARLTVIHIRR